MKSSLINYSNIFLVLILVNSFLFEGCQSGEKSTSNSNRSVPAANSDNSQSNHPKDNLEELLELVQLPELPDEVVWREETLGKSNNRAPGPTDRKITAVLLYKPEAAARLIALVEKNKQPEPVEIGAESWFPEELTAQAQMAGNEMLKGTAYGANQFFNIPYGSGQITRIEGTNYFVLELTAQ